MNNQEEIWKDVVGHENIYQVSNLGNVRSCKRNKLLLKNGWYLLRMYNSANGYKFVRINNKTAYIHRLVSLAFLPSIENKKYVNHINGIKDDNRLDNLEWCTAKENTSHAIKTGLILNKGECSGKSKLTESHVFKIREMASQGIGTGEIAKEIGIVKGSAIRFIILRKRWNHI